MPLRGLSGPRETTRVMTAPASTRSATIPGDAVADDDLRALRDEV
jgi:hypothetical protein